MPAQIPYGPEQLSAAPMEGSAFVASLQQQMRDKYPDAPPFIQALLDGQLSKELLQLWVKDRYTYWDDALVYSTGAIYIKTNDEPLRTHMLRRMVDIEGEVLVNDLSGLTTEAYEELWLQFGEGLGLKRDEAASWRPFTRTHFATETLRSYSRYWDWTWLDGVAIFYAMDLHIKEYYERVHDALRDTYKIDERHLEFFRVTAGDANTHLPWEEEALAHWACTTERQLTAARSFRERLDIEYQMHVAVEQARTGDKLPFQIPA
jgi:pyrroloquinoline quinone (PQQ) biosynthesis protein C